MGSISAIKINADWPTIQPAAIPEKPATPLTKEEREAGHKMNILGNVNVIYNDSSSPDGVSQNSNSKKVKEVLQGSDLLEDDIPF